MVVHAAFGGTTNLLLHIPAIAHAAGLRGPRWRTGRRSTARVPRLVDVLPNGPVDHPTVRVFLAGGVPEVMLHLRDLGLLHLDVRTVDGLHAGGAAGRVGGASGGHGCASGCVEADGVDPDDVIMSPQRARAQGLTSTVTFPAGNLAPEGSVIKSTAIDPSVVDADGVYRKVGPARVFTQRAGGDRGDQGAGAGRRSSRATSWC